MVVDVVASVDDGRAPGQSLVTLAHTSFSRHPLKCWNIIRYYKQFEINKSSSSSSSSLFFLNKYLWPDSTTMWIIASSRCRGARADLVINSLWALYIHTSIINKHVERGGSKSTPFFWFIDPIPMELRSTYANNNWIPDLPVFYWKRRRRRRFLVENGRPYFTRQVVVVVAGRKRKTKG